MRNKKLNHLMRLGQMNAGCADFLPNICDGIKTDRGRPLLHIKKKGFYHLFKNFQALVIQIDLIGTEGGPDIHRLVGSFVESS